MNKSPCVYVPRSIPETREITVEDSPTPVFYKLFNYNQLIKYGCILLFSQIIGHVQFYDLLVGRLNNCKIKSSYPFLFRNPPNKYRNHSQKKKSVKSKELLTCKYFTKTTWVNMSS